MLRMALGFTVAALFLSPVAVTASSATGSDGGPVPAQAVASRNPLPPCGYADLPTPRASYGDWALALVDTRYDVPATYQPRDLVSTKKAGLNRGFLVRAIAVPDLAAMTRAAAAAGAPLRVASAYRSYRTQISTFKTWVRKHGYKAALLESARPGHSEHQLGLAIDFEGRRGRTPWYYRDWATDTRAGRWMAAHAWQYGWVMSYPAGKESKTCYEYEPWHYRYVGRAEAAAVHASGLTLREWLWLQQPVGLK